MARGHGGGEAVRAGRYAVVDGVEYRARFADEGDSVGLIVLRDEPEPALFEWDPGEGGRWWRDIPRSQAQRLFEVETWALLLGRFPVLVDFIDAGDRAMITYKRSSSPVFGTVPEDEDGNAIAPPGMHGDPRENFWFGGCDVADLSDVRETVREVPLVPLVPVVRVPVDPSSPMARQPSRPKRPKRPKPRSFH